MTVAGADVGDDAGGGGEADQLEQLELLLSPVRGGGEVQAGHSLSGHQLSGQTDLQSK